MLHQIDLSRADLNLLVLFEVVMEVRHVGRAAARLNLSPSAVSHALGRLRALLDDPLFLRTPKGVVPTERADTLAPQIAEILARVRAVVASAEPFDPARSEARVCDVAVLPLDQVPKRFAVRALYEEAFVVAARAKHPFLKNPSLERFLDARHLLVSETGDAAGIVDAALKERGLSRRVGVTVPSFALALALLAETDLLCALPRALVARNAARLGVAAAEPPLELPRYRISAVAPSGAAADAGLAWLVQALELAVEPEKE